MNMKTSLLCHSLLIALGLSASATALAQHDHAQPATQSTTPKAVITDDDHADRLRRSGVHAGASRADNPFAHTATSEPFW